MMMQVTRAEMIDRYYVGFLTRYIYLKHIHKYITAFHHL